MRNGMMFVAATAALACLGGCVTPDPPYQDMVANCPSAEQPVAPDDASLFFVTSRLPDCRAGPVRMTPGRGDRIRYGRLAGGEVAFHDPAAWRAEVERRAIAAGGRLILYVHGYNNDFADAAARAAIIDGLDGRPTPVIAFAWPSQAKEARYIWDEENAGWTEPYFRGLLADMLAMPGVGEVAIVAHSMGNRVVLRSLATLQDQAIATDKVRTLVLAAPDVDRAIFGRDYLPTLLKGERTVTVYRSNRDYPLNASWRLHGYARAGDANCLPWRARPSGEEIECRDPLVQDPRASFVDTSRVRGSKFGHADFVDSAVVRRDLCRVLQRRTEFPERSGDPAWPRHFRLADRPGAPPCAA